MYKQNLYFNSRRKFIHEVGLSVLSFSILPACMNIGESKVSATDWVKTNKEKGKLGVALVGLGGYAGGQLAPALQETQHCYLSGIVTGTPSKAEEWKSKYKIPGGNVYSYENFDKIKDNSDIDIVYVVLPNSLHAEYVIRAAAAGKHVICEKPMALSVEDCDRMIEACRKANRMLSIGYRLHFEPYNLEMARLGQQKVFGNIQKMNAGFGFSIGDPSQWRLKKSLSGGGPLQDVGIYCIQGICYTTGMTPLSVTAQEGAKTNPGKFPDVEESLTWQMQMSGGLTCEGKASYASDMNELRAEAERGKFELRPAFNYSGQQGSTPNGKMDFPRVNQQALQMDDFAQAIKDKRPTPVPGEMGKRDVKIISAIYEAMASGGTVQIK